METCVDGSEDVDSGNGQEDGDCGNGQEDGDFRYGADEDYGDNEIYTFIWNYRNTGSYVENLMLVRNFKITPLRIS